MRATTIARNYAEALLVLARKANDLDGWGLALNGVVTAVENDARLRNFLAPDFGRTKERRDRQGVRHEAAEVDGEVSPEARRQSPADAPAADRDRVR
jgi:hypothetical protein